MGRYGVILKRAVWEFLYLLRWGRVRRGEGYGWMDGCLGYGSRKSERNMCLSV